MAKTFEVPLTPTERLRLVTLSILEKAIMSDIDLKKQSYIQAVKNFLRLIRSYMPDSVVNKIEEFHATMENDIKVIRKKTATEKQKEVEIIECKYKAFDDMFMYGIDTLMNSGIIERDIEGIIVVGKTKEDRAKLIKKIRSPRKVEIHERES